MKKICVLTGTRAEYGLFYPLLKELQLHNDFQLQILATGMHLSADFGYTYKEIEQDGFVIDQKVEIPLTDDSESGIAKTIGHAVVALTDGLQKLSPDMVILLGDRFETFAGAVAAFMLKIPIGHLYGGELTEGAYDDALRHCITKFASLHFTSAEEYRRRVIQLGEAPERVFRVGYLNLDNIKNMEFLSRQKLETDLNYKLDKPFAAVTFHPVTLENNTSMAQMDELLAALSEFKDMKFVFTKPNADANGRVISGMIDRYVASHPDSAAAFTSLGRLRYLSLVRLSDLVIGNSSSGVVEVPSLGVPTVNIGDRQKGRIRVKSVIDCSPDKLNIAAAIKKALSDSFKQGCNMAENPFGDGTAAKRIVSIIETNLSNIKLKKLFYDLGC